MITYPSQFRNARKIEGLTKVLFQICIAFPSLTPLHAPALSPGPAPALAHPPALALVRSPAALEDSELPTRDCYHALHDREKGRTAPTL